MSSASETPRPEEPLDPQHTAGHTPSDDDSGDSFSESSNRAAAASDGSADARRTSPTGDPHEAPIDEDPTAEPPVVMTPAAYDPTHADPPEHSTDATQAATDAESHTSAPNNHGPDMVGELRISQRQYRRLGFYAATAWILTALLIGTLGYQAGRAQWSPPANVTVVQGAEDSSGVAAAVFENTHEAIVRIQVAGGGTGTGFFYGKNRIVTNAHVVGSSPAALATLGSGEDLEVQLQLSDGRVRTGRVVAIDNQLDVAVIATETGLGIDPLPFATGTRVTPGSPVVVIGHPFGGEQTVTSGIASGYVTNSQFAESQVQALLLQTDAAVNPGNSGGPLLDETGAVIGLITLRPDEVNGRAADGTSLAIPAVQVANALRQLEETGKASYPVMGVSLTAADRDEDGYAGAKVADVAADSGAARAGVKVGEVITAIDGENVGSAKDVIASLLEHVPGDRVRLTVAAKGAGDRDVTVVLGSRG